MIYRRGFDVHGRDERGHYYTQQRNRAYLMLMDEIGRGTSTFDGLSVALASAIRLVETNRAFTLTATHYFELTVLA